MQEVRIGVVSDVICPWCYIGKHRLQQALGALTEKTRIEVEWLPYEFNPDIPRAGIDRETYCVAKFGSLAYADQLYANVTASAYADGLPMELERIRRTPNTRAAHRLIWYAGTHGVQQAVVDGLFAAYLVDGRDVGDVAVLCDIGADASLQRDAIETWLAGHDAEGAVVREEQAASAAGVDGVPAFLVNGELIFSGAQSSETMTLEIS